MPLWDGGSGAVRGNGAAPALRGLLSAPWREGVLAAVMALACFGAWLGAAPVTGRDEARFAQSAREMRARGEWVVPTFGGEPRYHKPILYYWAAMASYACWGVSAAAGRLPSVLAGAVLVGLVAGWARRRLPPGAGLLAGLILVATPTFHVEARAATADMVMLLPTVAAMLALERVVCGDGRRRWALLFWSGMGLGILAKGPVAPALAASAGTALWALGRRWMPWQLAAAASLAVCGWWLGPVVLAVPAAVAAVAAARSPGARRTLARLRPGWGVPLLLTVVLPWTVAAWQATDGEFLRVAIGRHVVERALAPMESHGGFPGFYLLTAVVVAFPWIALAPRAVAAAAGRWRSEPELRFRVAWLLGWLVVVEMVRTKLVHYWLPAYPAGVLLVAWLLWSTSGSSRDVSRPERALLVVGALVLAGAPVAVSLHLGLDALLPRGLLLAVPLLVEGAALAVGRPRSPRAVVGGASMAGLLFLLGLVAGFLPSLGELGLGRRSAAALLAAAAPGDRLVVVRMRDDEILFDLPLDTEVWRGTRCPEAGPAAGGGVFVGRDADLDVLDSVCPGLDLERVARVRGLDLGHGRWATASVARSTSGRCSSAPPAGVAP